VRVIKLMPDYGCFPLWEASPELVGNIDPSALPLSDGLKAELKAWSAEFDSTLNPDDPLRSGFASLDDERAFASMGQQIREKLEKELGSNFRIIFSV